MQKIIRRSVAVLGAVGLALAVYLAVYPEKVQAQFGTPRYGAFETNGSFAPIDIGNTTDSTAVVYLPNSPGAVAEYVIIQTPLAGNISYTLGGVWTALQASGSVSYASNTVFVIPMEGFGGYNGALSFRFSATTNAVRSGSNCFFKTLGHY